MSKLRYYFPGGRVAQRLDEALSFDESFIVATADHELVYFVDWAELDDPDREVLLALTNAGEDEQYDRFTLEMMELPEDERAYAKEDGLNTILAWMTT